MSIGPLCPLTRKQSPQDFYDPIEDPFTRLGLEELPVKFFTRPPWHVLYHLHLKVEKLVLRFKNFSVFKICLW